MVIKASRGTREGGEREGRADSNKEELPQVESEGQRNTQVAEPSAGPIITVPMQDRR